MAKQNQLIIHADDLGICHSVNQAIFDLIENECLSSASAMVPGAYFDEVAEFAARNPKSDMGIHLTLLSDSKKMRYRPLSRRSQITSLLDSDGYFLDDVALFKKRAKIEHVLIECDRQITKARSAGLNPTHLDGHRDAFSQRRDMACALKLLAFEHNLHFRPSSRGKNIFSLANETEPSKFLSSYLSFLKKMKSGVSQIVVHPGLDSRELREAFGKNTAWGSLWRQRDYEILKAPEFKRELKNRGIRLVGWRKQFAN